MAASRRRPARQLTRNAQPINVSVNAIMSSNNGDVLLAAALAGRGVVLLPTFMAGPHIKAGHLKVVLDDFQATEATIYASMRRIAISPRKRAC